MCRTLHDAGLTHAEPHTFGMTDRSSSSFGALTLWPTESCHYRDSDKIGRALHALGDVFNLRADVLGQHLVVERLLGNGTGSGPMLRPCVGRQRGQCDQQGEHVKRCKPSSHPSV
jgi:hypothetical protein